MNRAPAFSPVLQLAPLAAALAVAYAIYAGLIGAWRKTARWLRGWWRSRHPVHKAPRQWHDEKFERVPADPRFHAAFGTPPWQDTEKPAHLSQSMTLSGPLPVLAEPRTQEVASAPDLQDLPRSDDGLVAVGVHDVLAPSEGSEVRPGRLAEDPADQPAGPHAAPVLPPSVGSPPAPKPCRCGRPAGHLEDACLTGEPGDIDREFSTGTFEAVKVDG